MSNVARRPLDDAHEPERRAADDDALEAQAEPEQVAVEGFDGRAGQHGLLAYRIIRYQSASRRAFRQAGVPVGPAKPAWSSACSQPSELERIRESTKRMMAVHDETLRKLSK